MAKIKSESRALEYSKEFKEMVVRLQVVCDNDTDFTSKAMPI